MRCQHCNYQIFAYSRCCPSCGRTVNQQSNQQSNQAPASAKTPQTRFDFWVAGLRKSVAQPRVRRTA